MSHYAYLLENISVGSNDTIGEQITIDQAKELLELAIVKFKLLKGPYYNNGNDCAEGRFFAYVGKFPTPHLALDNKSGTTRLYTITTKEELDKIR